MKIHRVITLAVILVASGPIIPASAWQSDRQGKMQDSEQFTRTIREIAAQVPSLGVTDELFTSKQFIAIYESPQLALQAAMAFIGRRDIGAHEKRIVGYAMQRLSADAFVAFISAMIAAVESGATPIDVLDDSAFPPFNFGFQTLLTRFAQPNVKTVLTRMLALKGLPDSRKEYIRDRVLTGRADSEYRDFMKSLGRPVKK